MTLVASAISPGYVLQASDRLVTVGRSEFDPQSNKSLVFAAPDGIVTMSYCGLAFINDMPTDERIARAISGVTDLMDGPSGLTGGGSWWGTRVGPIPRWPDVGQMVQLVARDLEDAISRASVHVRLVAPAVQVVGFQWSRRRPFRWRPIAWRIHRPVGGRYKADIEISPRPKEPPRFLTVMPEPDCFSRQEMQAFADQLAGIDEIDGIERHLVEIICEAAKREPTIGPDAMVVAMNPREGLLRARFVPAGPATATFVTGGMMQVAFSPWIIGRRLIAPPSTMIGDDAIVIGALREGDHVADLTLQRHAPPSAGGRGPIFYRGTQRRPFAPR